MSKKQLQIFFGALLSIMLLLSFNPPEKAKAAAPSDQAVVRVVLFFSPACGHCKYVRTEIFPLLYDKYGSQLDIEEIDISTEAGYVLFELVLELMEVPDGSRGVPFLVIENLYLVGSVDIPEIFPEIINIELQGDGTTWPDIPEMLEFLQTADSAVSSVETTPADEAENDSLQPEQLELPESSPVSGLTPREDGPETPLFLLRFQQDITGNSVAVAVLVGMILAVIITGVNFMRTAILKQWPWWITPILIVIGFGVAAYLSGVEVSGGEAICGPVGDCNAVQSSAYARLFGLIHIGVLGMIGYVLIAAAWVIGRWGKEEFRSWAHMAAFLFTVFGTLFSIYLTFLEPFVIGATCMWCITSAIVMTLLMLIATPVALDSWMAYDEEDFEDED